MSATLSAVRVRLEAAEDCRADRLYTEADRHEYEALKLCFALVEATPIKKLEELRAHSKVAKLELYRRMYGVK